MHQVDKDLKLRQGTPAAFPAGIYGHIDCATGPSQMLLVLFADKAEARPLGVQAVEPPSGLRDCNLTMSGRWIKLAGQ